MRHVLLTDMGIAEFTRARDRLLAANTAASSVQVVCGEIVRAFHEVVAFDACSIMTTDPETLLPSGGVVVGFQSEDCVPFWDNELLDPDFNKFNELARSNDHVATLYEAVDGDLERSPRYVKLYRDSGASDELRTVFVAGSSCLAVGVFVRPAGLEPFRPEELSDVRELIPVATSTLRRALGRFSRDHGSRPPAVVMLDARIASRRSPPAARRSSRSCGRGSTTTACRASSAPRRPRRVGAEPPRT